MYQIYLPWIYQIYLFLYSVLLGILFESYATLFFSIRFYSLTYLLCQIDRIYLIDLLNLIGLILTQTNSIILQSPF